MIRLHRSVAVLAIASVLRQDGSRMWAVAAGMMVLGVLLFSGSIYRAGLMNLDGAGPLAPMGGSLLILSWLVVAVAAWRERA